jgi:hypothetical protein
MSILNHRTDRVKPTPCPCEDCEADRDARALATHLGLADEPDPTIEADARAADAVRWSLWSPILKRPTDDDEPDEWVEAWEFPGDDDRSWAAQFSEEGCAEDDLSPWEEALEVLTEPAWERACREHAEEMEAMAQEALYHELVSRLGGFCDDC